VKQILYNPALSVGRFFHWIAVKMGILAALLFVSLSVPTMAQAQTDPRVDRIISILERMDQRMDALERRLDGLEQRYGGSHSYTPTYQPSAPSYGPTYQADYSQPSWGQPFSGGYRGNNFNAQPYGGMVRVSGMLEGMPYTMQYDPTTDSGSGFYNGQQYYWPPGYGR
jgi:hypothetical protein